MVINHLLTGMILQVSPFPIGRYGGVESLDAWRWTWHLEPNKIIPARDPKQCKNKMQWSDIHSSPYRQSHITFHHITTSTTRILFVGLESYVGPRSICQEPGCFWPVSDHSMWPLYMWGACVSTMCEQHERALHVWPLYVSTLCVSTLCVSTLRVSTLCVTTPCVSTMCGHSMCDHSMCDTLCVSTLCVSTLCVTTPCVSTPCVSTLCVSSTSVLGPGVAEHRKVRKLQRKQFLGRMLNRQKSQIKAWVLL